MTPLPTIGLCWLLFGGLHVGLATGPVRRRLVAAFGERGYVLLFSAIAAAAWSLLVVSYAAHRADGPAGLALGTVPWLRGLLMAAVFTGVVLIVAGNAVYDRSPYAIFSPGTAGPRGLERVTRHPFLAGVTLFAVAHALLATHATGTVTFTGLALLAILGGWHQDRKLLARRGEGYAAYLTATSAVPFAAVLTGRQRLVWHDLPLGYLVAGAGVAWWLRSVHDAIFAAGGVYVILVVLGGAALQLMLGLRRLSRPTTPSTSRPAAPMLTPAPFRESIRR